MPEHVHEWVEVYENMLEGVRGLALGDILARCSSGTCDAELREPEILRRLNATEKLRGWWAGLAADILREGVNGEDSKLQRALRAYNKERDGKVYSLEGENEETEDDRLRRRCL